METTKTAKSSLQFNFKKRNCKIITIHFNYLRILPSTFDELVSLAGLFVVRKGSISFLSFLLVS